MINSILPPVAFQVLELPLPEKTPVVELVADEDVLLVRPPAVATEPCPTAVALWASCMEDEAGRVPDRTPHRFAPRSVPRASS